MKTFFVIIAGICLLASILMFLGAPTAVQEIEAGIAFLSFVMALGFAAVLDRLPDHKEPEAKE